MANYKRREFIKASLSAGFGSAGLGSAIAGSMEYQPSQRKPIQKNKSVIVAGGGIAGLCCGYELLRRGFDVVVLEASPRHGGHVFTARDGLSDGLYADYGAEHITRPAMTLLSSVVTNC